MSYIIAVFYNNTIKHILMNYKNNRINLMPKIFDLSLKSFNELSQSGYQNKVKTIRIRSLSLSAGQRSFYVCLCFSLCLNN